MYREAFEALRSVKRGEGGGGLTCCSFDLLSFKLEGQINSSDFHKKISFYCFCLLFLNEKL